MITKDGPLWLVVVSVATGASIGALIRWGLTYIFNGTQWFLSSPLGTVFSNLIAAYLMGAVLAWLSTRPDISPAVRLFIITGFLGALSTLTAVLGENLHFMLTGQWLASLEHFAIHLGGAFFALVLGVLTVRGHL